MDNIKYDAILYVKPAEVILETDSRIHGTKIPSQPRSFTQYNVDDPQLYNAFTFGKAILRDLNNMGEGYFCKVTDFKKWVVVEISKHDEITGKTSSKTFLVVFQNKGDGIVLSTHNRYRSISGVSQAISYIKSACSVLSTDTKNRAG